RRASVPVVSPGVAEGSRSRIVKPLAATAVVISAWLSWMLWSSAGRALPNLDMRSYYMAGYMVRIGKAPLLFDARAQFDYQSTLVSRGDLALPYIHPPYEALLYAPFTLLGYREAYFTFLVFNLLVLAWIFWVLRPELSTLQAAVPWLPLAMFVFFL